MLADPRSEALSTNFADQWLHLQNLKDVNPDLFLFPNFDQTLAQSMRAKPSCCSTASCARIAACSIC